MAGYQEEVRNPTLVSKHVLWITKNYMYANNKYVL